MLQRLVLNLAKKMYRKDIRLDEVTYQLLAALVVQNTVGPNNPREAALIRSAIYRMAEQDLPEQQFKDIVSSATTLEKVVYDL